MDYKEAGFPCLHSAQQKYLFQGLKLMDIEVLNLFDSQLLLDPLVTLD